MNKKPSSVKPSLHRPRRSSWWRPLGLIRRLSFFHDMSKLARKPTWFWGPTSNKDMYYQYPNHNLCGLHVEHSMSPVSPVDSARLLGEIQPVSIDSIRISPRAVKQAAQLMTLMGFPSSSPFFADPHPIFSILDACFQQTRKYEYMFIRI